MSFIELTTDKYEKTLVNLDYVTLMGVTRKGVFVSFADGDFLYCRDDFEYLCEYVLKNQEKV